MSKEDNRTRFTFRMPEMLLKKLRERANKTGVSVNALILQILWDWVQKSQGQTKEREQQGW